MGSPFSPALSRAIRHTCNLVVAGFGLLTLVGWIADIELLASLRADYIPMAPSTAVAFTCLGTAMFLRRMGRAWRRVALGLTLLVTALAAVKLSEVILATSFGIDEVFVVNPPAFGLVSKGRMSPITASSFLLSCLAILACYNVYLCKWSGLIATAPLGINAVVLLGYLHGTPMLYGATIIPVALPTASAFFLLSISVILEAGPKRWPFRAFVGRSAKALLLRWFLPLALGVGVGTSLLRIRVLEPFFQNPAVVSAISTLLFIVAIIALISQLSRVLGGHIDQAEAERNEAQASLVKLNEGLEETIEERTRELRLKHKQMEEETAIGP